MGLEKELSDLAMYKEETNKLSERLNELYKAKEKSEAKLREKGNRKSIREEIVKINREINDIERTLIDYKKEMEILEIIIPALDKKNIEVGNEEKTEMSDLKKAKVQTNYLNKKLNEFYIEKREAEEEIKGKQSKDDKKTIKKEIDKIDEKIEKTNRMLTYYKEEIKVLNAIVPRVDKKNAKNNIADVKDIEEAKEMQVAKKRTFLRPHKPEHAKQTRFEAFSKEMAEKIKILCSKAKEKYGPKLKEFGDIGVNAIKKAGKNVFSAVQNLYYKRREGNRNLRNKLKSTGNNIYIAQGNNRRKMKAFIAACLAGISVSLSSLALNTTIHSKEDNNNNSYHETTDKNNDILDNIEVPVQEGKHESPEIDNNANNSYHEMTGENTSVSDNIGTIIQEDKQEMHKITDKDNSNLETENVKDNDVNKGKHVDLHDIRSIDQIKTIYGGEISASENGIRTKSDILFAVTQMGWSKQIIDNINEMMPGLLRMQKDFDVDPLVFLAVAQGESNCGTAYQPGGSDYARDNDYRAVNIEKWAGQLGVVNYSNTNYGIYSKWSDVPYDFGNYLRNGPPYTETPALTMKDLKEHGGYEIIFNSADTKYAAIYNQLKACLEKRVTLSDISNATRTLRASQIKEMSSTITSSINKQRAVNKSISGR